MSSILLFKVLYNKCDSINNGVFKTVLKERGFCSRVIENCLNGRRTVWDDPFKSGRNDTKNLA